MVGVLAVLVLYIHGTDEWTYYGVFRNVTSICGSPRYVYVAGENGITRYDKLMRTWAPPKTQTRFPGGINLIAYDLYTNELWFTASGELGRYNPIFEDYRVKDLPAGFATPCSIGVSKEYIYLNNCPGYTRRAKLGGSWQPVDSLSEDIDWYPKINPWQYPWLAPYYVMDKFLRRYRMTCVAEDEHWLWVGTEGMGVYVYSLITHMEQHYLFGIPSGKISALCKDGDKIWLSAESDIVLWDPGTNLHTYYSPDNEYGLLSAEAQSIVTHEDKVWFGTSYGVTEFDKQENKWQTYTTFDGLPAEQVTALALYGDELLIGTINGLAKLVNGAILKIVEGFAVNDIAVAPQFVYVATPRGVLKVRDTTWTELSDPNEILPHGVNKILVTGDKIYFGARQGLLVYDGEEWHRYNYPVFLPDNDVLCLAADSAELWVGTDRGAALWDRNIDFWFQYTHSNSPIGNSVYDMILDSNYIYFGTESGLVRKLRGH